MAHLSVDGLEILVSSLRNQTFCPAVFAKHGIDVNTCEHRCICPATSSQCVCHWFCDAHFCCLRAPITFVMGYCPDTDWLDLRAPATFELGSGNTVYILLSPTGSLHYSIADQTERKCSV